MSQSSKLSSKSDFVGALVSCNPGDVSREKLQLFGQFVGDWDIVDDRTLGDDGKWIIQHGELHWGWILGGNAVQDVWSSRDEKTGEMIPDGTTIRFYDPKIDAWRSTWISPPQCVVRKFIGRKVGDEIVLEEEGRVDRKVKWIFSGITPNSFRWHCEESFDNGKSWLLKEEMRIRRRSPSAI